MNARVALEVARGFRWFLILGIVLGAGMAEPAMAARPDESAARSRPDPAAVLTYGPAYRYPRAGWIVVHVEGTPYDRGYQHGRLLAPEIVDYIRTLSSKRSLRDPAAAWDAVRTTTNALFLRRYNPEYLEEMKGIADGASAAGARFEGRELDLLDVASVNSDIELEFLDAALDATPTGLEARRFSAPPDIRPADEPPDHCSAFVATGPATADGKVVIGHITMFSLPFVRHFNVWLDVKPEKGHRVMMQTYPGGIQSGMDYYMNDAGLVVAETTVRQTRFHGDAEPLASRIRRALQYGSSIDDVVQTLKAGNNGLYSNEWLIADTKSNEIAMFELGTHRSKLWRSSKDEWFGGTKGFYWGCNNPKELEVRLETVASVEGRPANLVFHPSDRDRTWLRLYEKHKGRIAAEFGFEAFTTPPLSAFSSLDAKVTTAALAGKLETWAIFGPPMGRTWDPTEADRKRWGDDVRPLVSNDWTVLSADRPPTSAVPPAVAASGARAFVVPTNEPDLGRRIERLKALRDQQRREVARQVEAVERLAEQSGAERKPVRNAATLDAYRRMNEELTRVEVLRISVQSKLDQLRSTRDNLPAPIDPARRGAAIQDLFHSEARVAVILAQKARVEARLKDARIAVKGRDDAAVKKLEAQVESLRVRLGELFKLLEPSLQKEIDGREAGVASLGRAVESAEQEVRAIRVQEEALRGRLQRLRTEDRAPQNAAVLRTFAESDVERARATLAKIESSLIEALEQALPQKASARVDMSPPSAGAADLLGTLTPGQDGADREPAGSLPPAWRGTLLPGGDEDVWLAAAFADFEPIAARARRREELARQQNRPLTRAERDASALDLFEPYSRYRTAVARLGRDVPLKETRSSLTDGNWYGLASGKGVLLLNALRAKMGARDFADLMDAFGRNHAGKPASSARFREAAIAAAPDLGLGAFFDSWLSGTGLPGVPDGAFWSIHAFEEDLDRTVIVVGTRRESEAQREAGLKLQRQIQRKWSNVTVPILTDVDAKPENLAGKHILLIGRPETNTLTARLASALPVSFGPASFSVRGETYAHARSAVIAAGASPNDPKSSVVVFAGLSAEATWRCVETAGARDARPAEVLILPEGA
ncbi:MAG: C45 family autoproteolytic acyltransferase/hydrolase, partial [Isosphaeraceae bacterium]